MLCQCSPQQTALVLVSYWVAVWLEFTCPFVCTHIFFSFKPTIRVCFQFWMEECAGFSKGVNKFFGDHLTRHTLRCNHMQRSQPVSMIVFLLSNLQFIWFTVMLKPNFAFLICQIKSAFDRFRYAWNRNCNSCAINPKSTLLF